MSTTQTLEVVANQNTGVPEAKNFRVTSHTAPEASSLEDGDLLVQLIFVSSDPYLRSAIRSDRPNGKKPGEAMVCFVSGKVLSSRNARWSEGDLFGGNLPVRTIQVVKKEEQAKTIMWKLTEHCTEEELSLGIGVLGMPGSTAYGGLTDILRPKTGETLLVNAASGAVGQLVGQFAKHVFGCRVIGVAGGEEKCSALRDTFGFDDTIDYKSLGEGVEPLVAAIKKVAPGGLDMVFENVGGEQFEAGFRCLKGGGRIAVCGGIAGYGMESPLMCSIDPTAMSA